MMVQWRTTVPTDSQMVNNQLAICLWYSPPAYLQYPVHLCASWWYYLSHSLLYVAARQWQGVAGWARLPSRERQQPQWYMWPCSSTVWGESVSKSSSHLSYCHTSWQWALHQQTYHCSHQDNPDWHSYRI